MLDIAKVPGYLSFGVFDLRSLTISIILNEA